jgi:hypothetical protein
VWEQEGFCCTSAYLRGDVKEELKGPFDPTRARLRTD